MDNIGYTCNSDVSRWDNTSSITSMASMLYSAYSFHRNRLSLIDYQYSAVPATVGIIIIHPIYILAHILTNLE